MPFAKALAILLALALPALGLTAIVLSRSVEEADAVLERALAYETAWSTTTARFEAQKLEVHVARYAALSNPDEAAAARTALAVLQSRLRLFARGEVGRFLSAHPRIAERVGAARTHLSEAEPLLTVLETEGSHAPLLAHLAATRRALVEVAAAAQTIGLTEAFDKRADLDRRQAALRMVVAALLATGLLLLVLLFSLNRILARSRETAGRQAEHLAHAAAHDGLTGLANRRTFAENLAAATSHRTQARQARLAVLALDLDGFKNVNDTLGHEAGDELLASVAGRLRAETGAWHEDNLVARLGGDEFAILLRDVDTKEALAAAERLRVLLRRPHKLSCGSVSIDATIGVAGSPETPSQALRENADLALTRAKQAGKARVLPYCADMREEAERRLAIEQALDGAVASGAIRPVYQPKVDLVTGKMVSVEALARWRDPALGQISPATFVPIAEASGQIVAVGESILEQACREATLFPGEVVICVNVSVVQLLRTDLPTRVGEILARTGLSAERLQLEVTESVMMEDAPCALASLGRLKAMGIRVALDDFGTGYSALAYLQRFSWDELKIDRAFVRDLENDAHSRAIVACIVELSRALGIRVVAEGVETHDQVALLRAAGCRIAQGFLFGKPASAKEIVSQSAPAAGGATQAA